MVSRSIDNHSHYKRRLLELGYSNPVLTALEKDALDSLIREMKPDILIMGARFYECATPYQIGELTRRFPNLYIAVLSIGYYPDDLAMYCVLNGAKAYATTFYGLEQWYEGLEVIKRKGRYIAPKVIERVTKRKVQPEGAGKLTEMELVVTRLICNRHRDLEVADRLGISRRTVDTHKSEIFRKLNVRSSLELCIAALSNGIVTMEEICFYPANYTLPPLPEKENKPIRGRI